MDDIEIRRARPADAETLTALAHAAKRYWRYPEGYIELWRDALTVTPDFVERHPVFCASRGGTILGFYALSGAGPVRELDHMWVLPHVIGKGVGTQLMAHAIENLRASGVATLRIAADPNAEDFYTRFGARRVGDVASQPEGRTLPLLILEVSGPSR